VAEEARGEVGYHLAPFGCGRLAVRDQRRAGADVDDPGALQAGAQTADEEGHVGTLPAAVGVELVEDEKEGRARVRSRRDEWCVLRTIEQELGHHVVGEEEVGWVATDRLALFVRCLAGVAREAEGEGSAGPFLVPAREFGEGVELRIDERVHRVDDEGEGAGLVRVAGSEVDDRDEVAVALAGAGTGGNDHAPALLDSADRLHLVRVEAEGIAIGSTEDLGGRRVEHPFSSEVVDRRVAAVGGGELDERFWPEVLLVEEEAVDLVLDARVAGGDEGTDEVLVVRKDAAM